MPISQQKSHFPSTVPCDLAIKILNRVPPEHRHSFTPQQVRALQQALVEKRRPTPGFRVSLGPFYLSLIAGSYTNSNLKGSRQSMLVPILCILVSMMGIGCVAGLIKFRYSYYQASHGASNFQSQEQTIHPTVLPFRKNQSNCEKNEAVWVDGKCIDHNHDPTF